MTSPPNPSPSQAFVAARDTLLRHRGDLAAARADFRWPALTEFNWALDWFDVHARDNGATALWVVNEDGSEQRASFAEMAERSNRVANWLRARGVARGDRLLLMLGNVPALWEVTLAAIKLGAVVSPATTLLGADDLRDRIQRGRMRHVIADAAGAARFAEVPGDYGRIQVGGARLPGWADYAESAAASPDFVPDGPTRASDPLLLYFTSGTTAKPKMVLHTHASYPVGHLTTMYWLGLKPGDVHLNISSPGWGKHAWSSFYAPWNAGATIFVLNQARFDARFTLDTLVRCGVTSLCAPPTVWRVLILEDLAQWQVKLTEVIGAGEPLNPEVIERVRAAWGLTLRDGYGQTESTCMVGNPPGLPVRAGSMGQPMPGYRMVLLDADDREADEGELAVALQAERPTAGITDPAGSALRDSPSGRPVGGITDPAGFALRDSPSGRPVGLMHGYAGDEEKTRAALGGAYYRTSDVARRDADGYLWYVGRADDVFKASDYRISPFELESALLEHPQVAEAAVVPSPDPIKLAVPKAVIVLKPGVAPSRAVALDILRFLRERLSPYKRIRRIEFAELPKTISGKIRRVQLRQAEDERRARGARGALEFWEEDFPELR
ncbi:MAG: AMP-binding protein [Burkholderiales bacterium]|nr:AMP-binding protein [Burkholderiales bacterium]